MIFATIYGRHSAKDECHRQSKQSLPGGRDKQDAQGKRNRQDERNRQGEERKITWRSKQRKFPQF